MSTEVMKLLQVVPASVPQTLFNPKMPFSS